MSLKKPPVSYQQLRGGIKMPRAFADPTPDTDAAAPETTEPAAAGPAAASPSEPLRPTRRQPPAERPSGRQQVYTVRIPYPKPGASKRFDEIAATYGADEAMKIAFRLALQDWLTAYGPTSPLCNEPGYAVGSKHLKTTKSIVDHVMTAVTARIDPLGHRAPSFIAQRICLSAMTTYLTA
jgi:hypothetical protein